MSIIPQMTWAFLFHSLIVITNAANDNAMNVLFIVSDDLRPDLAGLYGQSEIYTPNIDRLMQNGVTFTHSYTQCPICSPSRTSFLTGLRPDTTRVWTIGPYFRQTMPHQTGLKVITLPQYFKQNGYYTVGGGKIFHPGVSSGGPSSTEGGGDEPYSWSEPYFFCDQFYNGTFQSTAMQDWPQGTGCIQDTECIQCLQKYNNSLGNTTNPAFAASSCPSKCYPEGAVVNHIRSKFEAISLNTSKQEPFFIAVGMKRPHLGWMGPQAYFDMYVPQNVAIAKHRHPPAHMPPIGFFSNNSELHGMQNFKENTSLSFVEYVDNNDVSNITGGYYRLIVDDYHSTLRAAYYAVVSWMDDQLGEILDSLQEYGYWNNTMIVFVGDHGYHLGELGLWCKNTPYEYSARVPTIFRIPGQMKGGGGYAVDDIVEMVDIYPTLVEAAGLEQNRENEGNSLLSYINGNGGDVYEGDNVAYTQTYNRWLAPNGTVFSDIMALSMRMNEWRYTEYVEYNWSIAQPLWENGNFGVELYNHTEITENDYDSYETYNLAYDEDYNEMVVKFHGLLVKQWPYGPNTTQIYPTKLYISPEISLYD